MPKEKTKTQNAPGERQVEESRAVSITVAGGCMAGEFVKHSTRYTKEGAEYSGWIIKGQGVIEDRATKAATPAPAGRYFVFSAQRLDRQLREVERGEKIRITYLGLEQNEKAGPDGSFGKHHSFKVVYLD
jgi:hypothetical protein